MRVFSIPYSSLYDPILYLQFVQKYKSSIHSIYFGYFQDHTTQNLNNLTSLKIFLEESYLEVPRVLAINKTFFNLSSNDIKSLAKDQIIPFLKKYKIESIIIADYFLASTIKQAIPEIIIQVSCNAFLYSSMQYKAWKDLGASIINVPREALRVPELLKSARQTCNELGLKLKALVNEACLIDCPQYISHACLRSLDISDSNSEYYYCTRKEWKYEDLLKTNFILPRHLKSFDKYVDIYKIAGRDYFNLEQLLYVLESYFNESNDCNLFSLITIKSAIRKKFIKQIPIKAIPDKILTCETKDCNSCHICNKVISKLIKDA